MKNKRLSLLSMALLVAISAYSQQDVSPISVNTDWVSQVGNEKAALTVKGPMVIGAFMLDPDVVGVYDVQRTLPVDINNEDKYNSVLLWVERGIVASVAFWTAEDWADHVFDANYELMSLSDLREFIRSNEHLPGVPSEDEIKTKGYSAQTMNKIMMVEIEELTLYTLQQHDRIVQLKETLNERIDQIEKLQVSLMEIGTNLGENLEPLDVNQIRMRASNTLNQSWKFEPHNQISSISGLSSRDIGTVEPKFLQDQADDEGLAKLGANTNDVKKGTVLNIKGKTVLLPESMEELPDLSFYVIDETNPDEEEYDFSMFIYGQFVAGDVVSRDLVSNWSDYVFDEGYDLMPLEELRNFISREGHLPKIPSAQELKEYGYVEFDMKGKFLEKIEELFLYQIKQQREIESLSEAFNYLNTTVHMKLSDQNRKLKKLANK